MDRVTLKKEAKTALKGNQTWAVLLTLLVTVIGGLVGIISSGLAAFVSVMLIVGYRFTLLDLKDGYKEENYFTGMFSSFTKGRGIPVFLTWLLSSIFIFLWSCLFVIPGIMKAMSYSQAYYIAKDMVQSGQDVSPTEAITKSRQIMHGHKMEYFVLQLSFLGWAILACLTAGIGFLWLQPYIQTTNAAYYRHLARDEFKKTATIEQK